MKRNYLFVMLLAIFAVVGLVAARQPGNVAAVDAETALSTLPRVGVFVQSDPTDDEDVIAIDDEEDYPDPFLTAAEAIGISEDALWEGLDSGQSIAELAAANGVDVQTVIDAMVAAENAFIDQLLADGEIDEAEAEEWRSETVEFITEMVNEAVTEEFFGEEAVDPLTIMAETIGVDEEALWETLDSGKTVAEIAQENNVDPQTVIDALVAAETAWIDELVADGEISEEEAAEWRTETAEYAAEFVNNGLESFEYEEDFVDPILTAAGLIGVDEEAIWEATESGKTIADVAAENNIDPQTIIDAIIAEENALIDKMLADSEISEAEAEEWRTEVATYAAEFVNEVWEFEDFEDGIELYFPEKCVIEANGASLADLEVPEACLDGVAVFGMTAVTN